MTDQPGDAVEVLRAIWSAQGQGTDALDSDDRPEKVCRNMRGVTFEGFAEPGADLRTAWRDRLAREGKLNTSGDSIRDLALGPPPAG